MDKNCCDWALKNKLEKEYHDTEWGVPVHDDRKLFEILVLEYMQAGLSWTTILSKRTTMTKAFSDFDTISVANYTEQDIEELMNNNGVIRNKLKLKALPVNAQAYINIQKEFGSFSNYLWAFVDSKPVVGSWNSINEVPSKSELSDIISKDLKKRGFKFLGSTTVYAFLQAVGVVNDHVTYCDRFKEIGSQK